MQVFVMLNLFQHLNLYLLSNEMPTYVGMTEALSW